MLCDAVFDGRCGWAGIAGHFTAVLRSPQRAQPDDGAAPAPALARETSPIDFLVRALETFTESTRSVAEAVAKRLAIIFNVSAEEIDLAVPMTVHGVDALDAVGLRNWLSEAARVKIPIFEIHRATPEWNSQG